MTAVPPAAPDPDQLRAILDAAELSAMLPPDAATFCASLEQWLATDASADQRNKLDADLAFLKGQIAYIDGDLTGAERHYQKAAAASRITGDIQREIESHRALALCCEYTGQQAKSIDHVFRSLELAEHHGEPLLLSRALSGLIALYESQGAFEQALETVARLRDVANEINDLSLLGRSYAYSGLFCGYLKRTDEGFAWLKKATDLCALHDLPHAQVRVDLYRFFLLHEAGRIAEAVAAAESQLASIAHLPAQNAAASYVDVAEIYVSAGNFAGAATMLERADSIAQNDGLKAHLLRYYKVAADLHEARGETAVALRMLRRYGEMENELRGEQARARLVTVERHFASELAAKTAEIHHLRTVELVDKNRQLSDLVQQKDEILHVVVHDLRNPLAAAQLLGESLVIDLQDEVDPEAVDRLRSIGDAATEMRVTVDTLLSSQQATSHVAPALLVDAVRTAIDEVSETAELRQVEVERVIEPVDFMVNSALLRRSLGDLLSIAIESSKPSATVTVEVAPLPKGAQITVSGKHIRFEEAGFDGRSLYIARRLVERMNGSVTLTERTDEGARAATIELRG